MVADQPRADLRILTNKCNILRERGIWFAASTRLGWADLGWLAGWLTVILSRFYFRLSESFVRKGGTEYMLIDNADRVSFRNLAHSDGEVRVSYVKLSSTV